MDDATNKAAERNECFRQLQKMFIGAAVSDVSEMAALLAAADGVAPAGDAGARFRKLAHDLRGTGGGYEFPTISDTAANLEAAYLTESSAEALKQSLALLSKAVDDARQDLDSAPASTVE